MQTGSAKTKMGRIILFSVGTPIPTDKDDEFGDGAQNAYKIIKSLTSGARFYTETTLYCYRAAYRYLVMLLARAYGLLNAAKTRLNVSNAPNYAAYQAVRASVTENYISVVQNMPEYEKILLEMVSELNSLPTPTVGGMDEFFTYFAHLYRDDRGRASDYYSFCPHSIGTFTYSDTSKVITGVSEVAVHAMNIPALSQQFFSIVENLRDSVDINNLMADMLNTLPSSRYDWMSTLKAHSDYVRNMTNEMRAAIGSATLQLATASSPGELNSTGTRVTFQRKNIATPPSGYLSGSDDTVGHFITTYGGCGEINCYKFLVQNGNAAPGFTPANTDPMYTTGFVLNTASTLTSLGTATSAPNYRALAAIYSDTNSTVQSTAEQGGKELALLYAKMRALPCINLADYGTSGSDDNLLWSPEDIRIAAVADAADNIKAINLVSFSTVHLTTEKAR